MSTRNTLHKGSVRSVIFQEGGEWFGAALEFNIVESGTSPEEVMVLLDNAIKGYVEAAKKSSASVTVLHQEIDPEYEALWNRTDDEYAQEGKTIYRTSSQPLAALVA